MAVECCVVVDEAQRGYLDRMLPLPEGLSLRLVRERDAGEVQSALADAQVVVARHFPAWMAQHAPRLRLLHTFAGGFDDVAYGALPPHVTVAEAGGYEASVAEHAILLLLGLLKNLSLSERAGRRGCRLPGDAGLSPVLELPGHTVGILGFGRVGREVARRLTPFDCDILGLKRTPDGYLKELMGLMELGGQDFLPTMLRATDVLVIAMPLTVETRSMIGEAELALMKPGAFLVNVSRAGVVAEDPLYQSLATGRLRAAGLDVSYDEHAQDSPTAHRAFERLGNVIVTPRMAAYTEGSIGRAQATLRENLERFLRREPLVNTIESMAGSPALRRD